MSTMSPTLLPTRRKPYRLSVEQYERMIHEGVFPKRGRIELIEGQLVEKMTKNPPHSVTVGLCLDVIGAALPPGWHTRGEQPVRIPSRDSEPEPDVAVVRGRRTDWLNRHPGPGAIALLVEAADSSVEEDRALAPTYLGGGIPIYWIVNIRDRQLEVYSAPSTVPVILGETDTVDLIIDGQVVARIAVADLLPPRQSGAYLNP
jgi:Uma2 family endonuclease